MAIRTSNRNRITAGAIALATAFMCLGSAGPAAAMTAKELLDDGNRLFRDDLYWAALLRYRQAAEEGLDTPLLHYNSGVAHYRAKQHIRARESLMKAAASPRLRVVSHYNLGLNAYAAGDPDDALRWFRLARDQQENARISGLARKAISRIRARQLEAEPPIATAEQRAKKRKRDLTDFDFFARVGFGNDDNIFRAPGEPYVDFADPAQPLVAPEAKSGAYMPVSLGAKYMINNYKYEGFYGAYRLKGRYYQDKELDAGNEFMHEARFGNEFVRTEGSRTREVHSAFRIAQHDETYFDPDDGLPRDVAGVSIGDRLNFLRYGPDLRLRQSHERFSIGAIVKGYLYNYDEVETVPEYDHEYFRFGVHTQYKFTRTSLLRINLEKLSRRYGDRPSFDLSGNQFIGNPTLRYDYLSVGLVARQRITRNMWFGFEYERTDREDRFEGYNNYLRDHYEFDFSWSPGRRFDFDLRAYYRNYKYENAFAFNEPALGRKTLETSRGVVRGKYRMTPSLSLVVEGQIDESESNDSRIAYTRNQFMISVQWETRRPTF